MRKHDYFLRYLKMAPDDGSGGASSAPSTSGDGGGASVSPAPSGGDSGGSPPASPSPDPQPTAAPSDESPWANLGSADDLDYLEIQQQPTPAAPPPAEPPPPPAPVATPEPVVAAPPPAPAAPQQQPQPEAAQAPVELSPADPAGIAAAMYQHREQAIAHLAQDRFALSPEDIAELETDAATFVPKMMARVAFETQASMYKFLAQSVPGMIAKHTTVSKANNEAENKFFTINKDRGLDPNNAEHKAMAARLAGMYRQANPKMPFEQLASEVGLMVATALKLNGQPQPGTPIATPRGGQPFRPAVGGGGGASPAPAPADEWAGLGRNFDEG